MYHKYVKVLVVFTFDYSLDTWQTSGTLEKELKPFKLLNELKNIELLNILKKPSLGSNNAQKDDLLRPNFALNLCLW